MLVDSFLTTFKSLFFFSVAFSVCGPTLAASFDCAKAISVVEKQICSSELLSSLDQLLADQYSRTMNLIQSKKELTHSQILWLKSRDKCEMTECLVESYNVRIQELRRVTTDRVYRYTLQKNLNKYSATAATDNGVCAALLPIINRTSYQTVFFDSFGTFLTQYEDFGLPKWDELADGERRFGRVLEEKILHDERPSNATERSARFNSYKSSVGGFKYFMSGPVSVTARTLGIELPILMVMDEQVKFPDERRTWHLLFLSPDQRTYWSGEGSEHLEWSTLRARTIFSFKKTYFVLDAANVERINILPVEHYGDSVCSFNIEK